MSIEKIAVQLVGYIGLACAVIAFQCKSHKKVMIFRTLNELFFAIQYFCMGSSTGVIMNTVGSVRNMSFARCVEKGKSTRVLQIIFSVLFLVLGLLTTRGLISILVIAAKIVTTVAYSTKNTTYIRLLTLPTSICWLIYNAACGSTAGVLCEAFTIVSIVTAIIRLDLYLFKPRSAKGAR